VSPVRCVADVLDLTLAQAPGRLALVDDAARYSFEALDDVVARMASALYALGVREGDRVAASLPNQAGIVIALLAVQRLGAIWVGVALVLSSAEKAAILRDAGASVLLVRPSEYRQAQDLGVESLREVLAFDPRDPELALSRALSAAKLKTNTAVIDPHAPAAIAYTSGTTGTPKGAVHSQHNLMLMGHVADACGWYPRDMPHGVMLPLTTLNLMVLVPLLTLQRGAACVVLESTKALELARRIREERIGHVTAVPTLYYDLLHHPEVSLADLATLLEPEMGGANIPLALRQFVRARLGRDVCVGYGMTEAPATVTRTRAPSPLLPGCCGFALPHVKIEIRDEHDRLLPSGEEGEICVTARDSGPFAGLYRPMLGYWNRPEQTARVLRDGRYHSGDLGKLDADGQLFVLGRKTEMIVRGGAKIYPAEVERVLHEHPGVAAVAVLGEPDQRLGERVVAFIEPAAGVTLDVAALADRCEAALARYKRPERFELVERLPRNAMGKIVKRALIPSH